MMGVSGLPGDPAYPYHEPPLPPLPLGKTGNALAHGFEKLGWHWWPSDSAILSREYEGRAPCINLGPCLTGCTQGAKASTDITYWPAAERKGVQLRTGCRVREITVRADGTMTRSNSKNRRSASGWSRPAKISSAGSLAAVSCTTPERTVALASSAVTSRPRRRW